MSSSVIACDESGSEGENVTTAAHRVFVHGSVKLSVDAATEIIQTIRDLTRTKASEVKAEHVLTPRASAAREYLLGADSPLLGKAKAALVDKEYFIVAKVIDLLVEELAHAHGVDMYRNFDARSMAHQFHRSGERALKREAWHRLLVAFNSLMRSTQRKGIKTTVEEFFELVEEARSRVWLKKVSTVLDLIALARPHADAFQERLKESADHMPTLDPLSAAIPVTLRAWYAQLRQPLDVVHDEQAVLRPARVDEMLHYLRHPLPDFARLAPPVRVDSFVQVKSQDDPRVQVADLLAGLARRAATDTLVGNAPLDGMTPNLLQPYVIEWSVWSDDESWHALTGRRAVGE